MNTLVERTFQESVRIDTRKLQMILSRKLSIIKGTTKIFYARRTLLSIIKI